MIPRKTQGETGEVKWSDPERRKEKKGRGLQEKVNVGREERRNARTPSTGRERTKSSPREAAKGGDIRKCESGGGERGTFHNSRAC